MYYYKKKPWKSQVTGTKINIQIYVVFLYADNELAERESRAGVTLQCTLK